MPNQITELGNKIVIIDLSLAGHGCRATYSLGPPGGHCQVNSCCLNCLRHYSPGAVLLPLCQSSASQPLLQQVRPTPGNEGFEEGWQSLPGDSWGPGPCALLRRGQHPKPPQKHSHKPIFQVPFPPRHADLGEWETSCSTVHCELILSCRH